LKKPDNPFYFAANISSCFCISRSAKLSLGVAHEIQEERTASWRPARGRGRGTKPASDRLGRATKVLRGKEESRIFGKVVALLIGLGVGVGVGLLVAPASGEKTRADITDKVSEFGDKVRERTRKMPESATGTHGE
jgi:YtxH-like protein